MSVHVETSGPVTTIVNDRIEARNAGDPQTADALTAAFLAFEADPRAEVAVFWGAGGAFCAGWDLKYAATLVDPDRFRAEIVEGLRGSMSPPGDRGPVERRPATTLARRNVAPTRPAPRRWRPMRGDGQGQACRLNYRSVVKPASVGAAAPLFEIWMGAVIPGRRSRTRNRCSVRIG